MNSPSRLVDVLAAGPLGAHRLAGASLGPFAITRELGRGGVGAVYEATHLPSGQATRRPLRRFRSDANVSETCVAPDGQLLVGMRDDGGLEVWGIASFE